MPHEKLLALFGLGFCTWTLAVSIALASSHPFFTPIAILAAIGILANLWTIVD